MGAILNSVMEDIVKSFAGNSFKKQTVLNAMKNRGVTDAELEASGMKKFIEEYKGEKIPVEEMNKVIQNRTDKIGNAVPPKTFANIMGNIMPQQDYSHIRERGFQKRDSITNTHQIFESLHIPEDNHIDAEILLNKMIGNGRQITTDEAKTTAYNSLKQLVPKEYWKDIHKAKVDYMGLGRIKEGQYTAQVYTKGANHGIQNHFDVPNYYSHVRYTDVPEGNQSTRYVHELQSDVHQGAKDVRTRDMTTEQENQLFTADRDAEMDLAAKLAEWHGEENPDQDMVESFREDYGHLLQDLVARNHNSENGAQEFLNSPEGAKWLENSLGLDKDSAKYFKTDASEVLNSHAQNVNEILPLSDNKGQGFQQDENYLKNTVNKLLVDAANEGKHSVKVRIAPDTNLARSAGIQKWYENDVTNTLSKQAKKIGSEMKMTDDGYAEIPIPEKDFKLPMYSTAGLTMIGATAANKDAMAALPNKIKQAKDAGYSDDEIKQHLSKQYEPNVVDRATELSQPEDTSLHITVGRPQADQQQQGAQ